MKTYEEAVRLLVDDVMDMNTIDDFNTTEEITDFVRHSEGVELLTALYETDAFEDVLVKVLAYWKEGQGL